MNTTKDLDTQEQVEKGWISINDQLPPNGKSILTKIDDAEGIRNAQHLKRNGRLWFHPDGRTYVYYTPTHWLKQ